MEGVLKLSLPEENGHEKPATLDGKVKQSMFGDKVRQRKGVRRLGT